MANVLGELFGNIANSIRNGLGDIGKMKPNDFPGKIDEIVSQMGDSTDEIDKTLDAINGEVVGEAQLYVTFMNGVELVKVPVFEGYDCADPIASGLIETPTKESTKYLRFTFVGWSLTEGGAVDKSALLAVDGNRTVYAAYREDIIYVDKGSWTSDSGSNYMTWTLNPDYILEVHCEGSTAPHYDSNAPSLGNLPPWWAYQTQITSAVITGANGAKSVGVGWFYGCTALTSVTIFDDVIAIYNLAFTNCTALEEIRLPQKCRTIGNDAFKGTGLISITIPAETAYIYKRAFHGCNALKSVVFEKVDGWIYGESYNNESACVTVSEQNAADPTFALPIFADTRYEWKNLNTA